MQELEIVKVTAKAKVKYTDNECHCLAISYRRYFLGHKYRLINTFGCNY